MKIKQKQKPFIWKCLNQVLPVRETIFRRIGKGELICKNCSEEAETWLVISAKPDTTQPSHNWNKEDRCVSIPKLWIYLHPQWLVLTRPILAESNSWYLESAQISESIWNWLSNQTKLDKKFTETESYYPHHFRYNKLELL